MAKFSTQTRKYRPCAGHVLGFISIGIVVTKKMTFYQKCVHVVCVHFRCGGSVPAGWLAGCSSALGRYSELTGLQGLELSGGCTPVHVYRRSFWMKIGFKFRSLGQISNISTSDPAVLLRQFQHCYCDRRNLIGTCVFNQSSLNQEAAVQRPNGPQQLVCYKSFSP